MRHDVFSFENRDPTSLINDKLSKTVRQLRCHAPLPRTSTKSFTAVSCAARPIIDFIIAVSERHRVAFVFLLVTFPFSAFTRVFRSAKARERKRGPCSSVVIIVIGALISATRAPLLLWNFRDVVTWDAITGMKMCVITRAAPVRIGNAKWDCNDGLQRDWVFRNW